jgi:uncharacterized protein YndB with AHSA1/START domain
MVKKILIGLGVIIVVLCIVIATRPDTVHIERSANVSAPPETVFALVNDFHKWAQWAPWDKLDPAMKKNYEGGPGMGAKYHWVGNDQVGEGRMTITESQPPSKIVIKLEFIKPFEANNVTTFTIAPGPKGSQVVWAMDGQQNFMSKAFGLFMDMDAMVGKDFEAGLAALDQLAIGEVKKKEAAEKAAALAASPSPSPMPVAPPPPAAPPAKKKK